MPSLEGFGEGILMRFAVVESPGNRGVPRPPHVQDVDSGWILFSRGNRDSVLDSAKRRLMSVDAGESR